MKLIARPILWVVKSCVEMNLNVFPVASDNMFIVRKVVHVIKNVLMDVTNVKMPFAKIVL